MLDSPKRKAADDTVSTPKKSAKKTKVAAKEVSDDEDGQPQIPEEGEVKDVC
jgi:hypothetical protein